MDMSRILQIFIGAVLFLSSCSTKDNNETSVSPEMCLTDSLMQVVSIDTVHTRILIDELTLNGRVTFNQEQVVQVFPMFGGRVIAVNAEVGDYVHKGEVLAVVKSGEVAEYEKQLKDGRKESASDRRGPTRKPDNQLGKSATRQAAIYTVGCNGQNSDGSAYTPRRRYSASCRRR